MKIKIQNIVENKIQSKLTSFLWFIFCIYCLITFMPLPFAVNIGLDQSWQYGISYAADVNLAFGRDIIFTYGPLGYLLQGSVLTDNFWSILVFRLTVHLSLFVVLIIKIANLRSNFMKLSIVLSVWFAYIVWLYSQIDYILLFIFLIVLSFERIFKPNLINLSSVILGAFTGFCLLTKFSLGIYTFMALLLFLSTNVVISFIYRQSNILINLISLANAILASVSFVFLFLNFKINHIYILGFSILLSFLLAKIVISCVSKENKNILTIFWCLFYIIYISLLTAAIVYTSTPLIDYLLGSINISFGYSSAMSLVGSPWQLGLAISQIILILIIFYFVLAEGNIINICLNMSLIFVLFMSFKHGFVRQDIHTLAFATVTHLIVAIYISKLKRIKAKKFAYSVFIYLFLTWLLFPLEPTKNYTYTSVEKFFNLDQFYQKTSVLFNINSYREELNRASLNNLDKVKLPSSIMQILQHKTVDIFPWEVSIAGANDIKWKPRPVFQSYVAYTSFLDLINSESLENNPRDYIIYQFGSLDGRHPFTYEPATFFYIACNYRLSSKMPDFFKTYALSNLMLLEKRQSNLCSSPLTEEKLSVKWNNYLELKDQDFTLANINFNYSFWGNLYKKLFRIPPIMMQINLIDGSSYSYRIISENSNSGKGIIVSHLPTTDSEALSFFRGDLFAQVKSLKFSINNKFLFKQNINLVLTTYNFQSTYSEGRKRIDISHLESINFSHNLSNEYIGWIDSKHDNIKRGDMINAVGWATSIISGNPVWVLLTEGLENKPIAIARTTSPRPDVVNFYKNNDYGYSGWSVTFSSNNLKYKKNNIRAWVYEPATNKAIPLNGEYIVEIY